LLILNYAKGESKKRRSGKFYGAKQRAQLTLGLTYRQVLLLLSHMTFSSARLDSGLVYTSPTLNVKKKSIVIFLPTGDTQTP